MISLGTPQLAGANIASATTTTIEVEVPEGCIGVAVMIAAGATSNADRVSSVLLDDVALDKVEPVLKSNSEYMQAYGFHIGENIPAGETVDLDIVTVNPSGSFQARPVIHFILGEGTSEVVATATHTSISTTQAIPIETPEDVDVVILGALGYGGTPAFTSANGTTTHDDGSDFSISPSCSGSLFHRTAVWGGGTTGNVGYSGSNTDDKAILLVAIKEVPPEPGGPAPENTTLLDSFDRANGTVYSGGAFWQASGVAASGNGLNVASNQLASSSGTGSGASAAKYGPDVDFYFSVETLPATGDYLFGAIGADEIGGSTWDGAGWLWIPGETDDNWQIRSYTNGSSTKLVEEKTGTGKLAAGDWIWIKRRGETVQLYSSPDGETWTLKAEATEGTYDRAGYFGLEIQNTLARIDNLHGGTVGEGSPEPPVNTVAPAVTGTPWVGQTLSCSQGTWSPAGTSYAYQWFRDDGSEEEISGATSTSYTLIEDDLDHDVFCRVTATNDDGVASADSNALTVIEPPELEVAVYLSGGAENDDPAESYGGAESSTLAGADLLDFVPYTEADTGAVEYRCVYFHNEDAEVSAGVVAWLSTPLAGDATLAIGVATESAGSTVTAPKDDKTAPEGVSFSSPTSLETAIDLGTIDPGDSKGLWLRRTIDEGAAAAPSNVWQVTGEATPLAP